MKHTGLALILAVSLLTGCTREKRVDVAAILPITGRLSHLGIESRNALSIAVDEFNRDSDVGGARIVLSVFDNGGVPSQTAAHLQDLRESDVPVVFGPALSVMADAVMDHEDAPYLIVSPTMTTSRLTGREDNVIRMIPTNDVESALLAARITGDGHLKTAIIVDSSNSTYTYEVAEHFKRFYEDHGGVVVTTIVVSTVEEHDHIEIVNDIIDSDAAALLFVVSSMELAAIAQQIWKRGSDMALYGSIWTDGSNLVPEGGRSVRGLSMVTLEPNRDAGERAASFAREYERRYGDTPRFGAYLAYDAAAITLRAMERTGSLNPEEIAAAIVGRSHESIVGRVEIDRYGDAHRTLTVKPLGVGK